MSSEKDRPSFEAGAKRSNRKLFNTFSSLRNRNYRLLWIGGMLSHIGDDMQLVAVSWLVLVLTDSPFLMGVATITQGLPRLFFGLLGGSAGRFAEPPPPSDAL